MAAKLGYERKGRATSFTGIEFEGNAAQSRNQRVARCESRAAVQYSACIGSTPSFGRRGASSIWKPSALAMTQY
jgi:hypothetical protein